MADIRTGTTFNGEKLKAIIKDSGWTQKQVSKFINKHENYISGICNSWIAEEKTLNLICELLQCSLSDIGVGDVKPSAQKQAQKKAEAKPEFDVSELTLINEALEVIGKRLYQMEEEDKNFHVSVNSTLTKILNQLKYGGR